MSDLPPWDEIDPDGVLDDLPMLPDDKRYVARRLLAHSEEERSNLLSVYKSAWVGETDNACRFAANTYLRLLHADDQEGLDI